MYHSSSGVLMTNNTHSDTRKHREGTKPGTRKTGQMFFFFLLSSDRLAQYCANLSRWFTHETAAFCTEQCTTPSFFQSQCGQNLHGSFLKAILTTTVGSCAGGQWENSSELHHQSEFLCTLSQCQWQSWQCAQKLNRPFLQGVRFNCLHNYITWHNFPLPGL